MLKNVELSKKRKNKLMKMRLQILRMPRRHKVKSLMKTKRSGKIFKDNLFQQLKKDGLLVLTLQDKTENLLLNKDDLHYKRCRDSLSSGKRMSKTKSKMISKLNLRMQTEIFKLSKKILQPQWMTWTVQLVICQKSKMILQLWKKTKKNLYSAKPN